MKKILSSKKNHQPHWVGDGFPVRSIFTYRDSPREMSPFLLMDYAGPARFEPSEHIRGVGEHPHRGFETVTIVYAGEVEHRDSAGGGGLIQSGDVQWMTAASGLVHEEMHGKEFARTGGLFEMVQLWVNLPRKDKSHPPRYQSIKNKQIPEVSLPDDAGTLRVIAGEYEGHKGPALTFTPIDLWDVRLKSGRVAHFEVTRGYTTLVFVLTGNVRVGGEEFGEASLIVLDKEDEHFSLSASDDSKILLMLGKPIDEPVIGFGPFVMNTEGEIKQAYLDYQQGRMGQLAKPEGSET